MKPIRLILLPFLFLLWAGCGGSSSGGGPPIEDPSGDAVKGIILAPDAQTLRVGEEKAVVVHVLNESGRRVDNITLTWTVSDPFIAAVTPEGKINGLKAGETTVTASYREVQSNPVRIEVIPVSTGRLSVDLSSSAVEVTVGANRPLTAVVRDPSGEALDVAVTWNIADSEVAQVSDGVVVGLKEGETTITASFQEVVSAPARIVVSSPSALPVDSVRIVPESAQSLEAGKTLTFSATAVDRFGNEVSGEPITWTISNPAAASVDPEGTVTAINAGSAALTASAQGKVSPAVAITIVDPPPPPPTPQVTGFYPNADGIITSEGQPAASFNTPMAAASLQAGFTLQSATGQLAGTIRCANNCATAIFVPNGPLAEGTYTATLSTEVKSTQGVALPSTFSRSFTVRNRIAATCQPAPRETNGWEVIRGQEPLQDLWGVHFINECEGWAVGIEMTLAHTMDGGVTWERQNNVVWKENNVPQIPPDLYDVFFLDANTGWAAGWPEIVLATTDGGATWREQRRNAAYTQDVCLATDPTTGACTKKNWCDSPDPNDPKSCLGKKSGTYLRRIRFADAQNGWVVGRFGTLYRTVNGGATWTNPPQRPMNPVPCQDGAGNQRLHYTPHWFALDVISSQEIWIGGGWDDGTYCTGWNRAIIHTTDGGASWIYQNDHPNFGALGGSGRYQDIRLIGNFGWAVGEVGTILRTIDHGLTWQRVSGIGAGGSTLWGLSLVDPANLWITGTNGLILYSGNANAPTLAEIVWTKQESGTGTQLRRSSFVNPSFGWIAGQFRLFRTTTGGSPLPPPPGP